MNPLIPLFALALLAGAILPFQAGLNARMGKALADPMLATLMSFLVGAVGLLIYLPLSGVKLSRLGLATQTHWTNWTGGLFGAFYVASVIILFPRIGATLTFALAVAGQMVFSLVMDHYGWLETPVQPISLTKILGVLLIIGGVVLVRSKF